MNGMKRTVFILLAIGLLCILSPLEGARYYSIVGGGAGYRRFLQGEPENPVCIISPYLEYGGALTRRSMLGFNTMLLINKRDTSEILQIQFGGQYRYFYMPRLLYVGAGLDLSVESQERLKRDQNSENSGMTINRPKLFFNANVHAGLALPLFSSHNLFVDGAFSQSVPSPYPCLFSITAGILSFF